MWLRLPFDSSSWSLGLRSGQALARRSSFALIGTTEVVPFHGAFAGQSLLVRKPFAGEGARATKTKTPSFGLGAYLSSY